MEVRDPPPAQVQARRRPPLGVGASRAPLRRFGGGGGGSVRSRAGGADQAVARPLCRSVAKLAVRALPDRPRRCKLGLYKSGTHDLLGAPPPPPSHTPNPPMRTPFGTQGAARWAERCASARGIRSLCRGCVEGLGGGCRGPGNRRMWCVSNRPLAPRGDQAFAYGSSRGVPHVIPK